MLKLSQRGFSLATQIFKGSHIQINAAQPSLILRPEYGFAKHKEKMCAHRKRMYAYFRDLFGIYQDDMQKSILSHDLWYSVLIMKNAFHFQYYDVQLFNDVIDNIRSRHHTLTPPLAYEIIIALQDYGSSRYADVFTMLHEYFQKYFFVYTTQELQAIEKAYFRLSTKMHLEFNPIYTNAVASQKATYAISSKDRAKKVLEAYYIKPDYDLADIGYNRLENSMNIKFKDSGKQLTILGYAKFDSEDIKTAREKMLDSLYDVYIFESAPLTLAELKKTREDVDKISTGRDEVAEALRFLERKEFASHPQNEKLYWDYLRRVGEIALFNPADIEAYFKEYLSESKKYEINESERVVCNIYHCEYRSH